MTIDQHGLLKMDRETWLIAKLEIRGFNVDARGTSGYNERAKWIREFLIEHELQNQQIGKRANGTTITWGEAFAAVYGETL
jgi:hypothetical protein